MPFSAREHLTSHWLDLAEGRLRLDHLNRNGVGETFFPWATTPRVGARGDPGLPIPRASQESPPPPSSAALRPERVRRRSPSALRSPSRPRWSRARKQQGEVTWLTSAHSRSSARNSRARLSP